MKWIVAKIKWIMLVTGVLTASVFQYAMAPQSALTADFGHGVQGVLAELLVRNWGALVGLVGLMLIYGALVPPARRLVLSAAALSKLTFVILMVTVGSDYLAQRIRYAVVVDSLEVLLFVAYLVATRHPMRTPAEPTKVAS